MLWPFLRFSLPLTLFHNFDRFDNFVWYFVCLQVKVSKDDTIVLDGSGARDAIEERCNLLRESIGHTKSDYEKEKLQERLAKLHSGVAVIKVALRPLLCVMV